MNQAQPRKALNAAGKFWLAYFALVAGVVIGAWVAS